MRFISAPEGKRGSVWWPGAIAGNLTGLTFLAAVSIAFYEPSRDLPGLSHLYQLSDVLLGSDDSLRWLMGAAIGAHAVEMAATSYVCKAGQLSLPASVWWVGQTAFMGYFALREARWAARLSIRKQRATKKQ